MSSPFTVSKLDAARRQLDTAIRLYFSSYDPVSIHTLVRAAHQAISDLNAKAGNEPMIRDVFLNAYRPEDRQAVGRKLVEAENFFKHANRDHDKTLEFRPDATELWLLDACERYVVLTGENVPVFQVFRAWFMIAGVGAELVIPAEHEKARRMAQQVFPNPTRQSFFLAALPMASLLAGSEEGA